MKLRICIVAVALLLALGWFLRESPSGATPPPDWLAYRGGRQPVVGLGDADRLRQQYETWKEHVVDPNLVELLPSDLIESPGAVSGWVSFDAQQERIVSEIYGTVEQPFELWLVDNSDDPEASAVLEEHDAVLYVGSYSFENGVAVLDRSTERLTDREFMIDLVVVTPLGVEPSQAGLFYGSPTLFQRLHVLEQRLAAGTPDGGGGLSLAMVLFQSGGVPTGFPHVFSDLVTEGEDLFFNETFKGNGRTCGSCHAATENFVVDVDLIASLPPRDPLFLAEFSPPHIFGDEENLDEEGNPRRFENPALMRAFGLIVENLDGLGDLDERFTMRGIPHNIGMSVSVTRPPGSISFPDGPDERTGWSGDGSPFGTFACPISPTIPQVVRGTTRSFALGAVIQHFPRTLNRSFCGPDADFRLPNDHELDAFEAFLFALGRQSDLELTPNLPNELILADPDAETGKDLFQDPSFSISGALSCNTCHTNAGANSAFAGMTNFNFDTGVEEFIQNRMKDGLFTVVGEPRPIDGGFGLNPDGNFKELVPGPGNGNENFGDGTFNTVSLVEAADTAPFFHANIAFSLEDAILFYNSQEFFDASGDAIRFTPTGLAQVAAFLRAINALDNIENLARPRAEKAILALVNTNPNADDVINFLLTVAIADTQDAMEVLEESDLHDTGGLAVNAVKQLDVAKRRFMQAQNPQIPDNVRVTKIQEGIQRLENAVNIIRVNP